MAKKQAGGRLPGLEDAHVDDTPQALIDLALLLKREQTKEAKAKAATKQTLGALLDEMHNTGIDKFRVEIDGTIKWVMRDTSERIRFEKSETAPITE